LRMKYFWNREWDHWWTIRTMNAALWLLSICSLTCSRSNRLLSLRTARFSKE
jgi:hypothetical protein